MKPLFGTDPPRTMDIERAARITADALLIGWHDAALAHNISTQSIRRIRSLREQSADLEAAVKRELVATPNNLGTGMRSRAWANRPMLIRLTTTTKSSRI